MADSYAGLVYGISVQACDLVAASRAHASIHHALHAVDQIAQLSQKGTLQVESNAPNGVQRVPVEVWLLVEEALIDEAVRSARAEMIERLVCEECDQARAEDKAEDLAALGYVIETTDMLLAHFKYEAKSMREWGLKQNIWEAGWFEGYEAGCERHHTDGVWDQHEWFQGAVQESFQNPVSMRLGR